MLQNLEASYPLVTVLRKLYRYRPKSKAKKCENTPLGLWRKYHMGPARVHLMSRTDKFKPTPSAETEFIEHWSQKQWA